MENGRIRVLIADDHNVLCEGLKLYLSDSDLEVIGTASDGQQALEMTVEQEPDVLLLDLRMPRMDGFQALSAIKDARPETNVIILTGFATNENMTESFRLGASGFLSKSSDPAHIPAAIRVAAAGDAIVDRVQLQGAMRAMREPSRPSIRESVETVLEEGIPDLTKQEAKVLRLIASGLENKRIADTLCVSHNTVKTHMRNIYSKLGVNGRTQAAIWAMRNGIAD
jgi:DNA-binding NarL/FixJ family response regulator